MKASVYVLAAGILLVAASQAAANDFHLKDCGGEDAIAHFEYVELHPHPINLKEKIVTVTAKVDVTNDIPEHSQIKVKEYKIVDVFGLKLDIPIPCLAKKIGSCTHKACSFLKLREEQACPFFPSDVDCACPVKAGTYEGHNMTVPLPDISAFARFIASGSYKGTIKLYDPIEKKDLACVRYTVQLK